jgi:hypothetical protein
MTIQRTVPGFGTGTVSIRKESKGDDITLDKCQHHVNSLP